MKSLLIVGAGQFGQLVKELAELLGYEKIGFLDDNSESAVGKTADYWSFIEEYTDFIVAIGNPVIRKSVVEMLEHDYNLCNLIHPTAVISKSAHLSKGCIIEANVVINAESKVGKSSLLNAGSVINHNARVNQYSQIDCNAVVSANAVVPEGAKVESCTVWSKRG